MSLLNYVTDYGLINADVSDLKEQVENEFKQVFGDDLDVTAATPQGRLIEAETAARANMLEVLAYICNQINPNEATGQFLDSLSALTGCKRKGATKSSVIATLTGVPGTIIPAESEAKSESGDIWYLENNATIGENGKVDARFISQETGPISCMTGELTTIVSSVDGWETINNLISATLGEELETDASLRSRRSTTLYNGRSLSGDVISALMNVDNVESIYLRVNNGKDTLKVKGVTIPVNTLYACVFGGRDEDIAMALYMKNSAGCGYTGNTTVTVTDPWSNIDYDISFQRPIIKYIDVKVYVKKDTGAGDVNESIKAAVMDYQAGKVENVTGLQIGQIVSPFEIASAINIMVPGVFVKEVQVAYHGNIPQVQNLSININEIARINEEDIKLRFEE